MTVSSLTRASRPGVLAALLVAVLGTSAASAQDTTRPPVPHNQTLSSNPFGLMLRWFNGEYEHKLTNSTTWGISGSALDLGGTDLRHGNVLFRYYPQGAALNGFYLGGRMGVYHLSDSAASASAAGAGFELGYSWLFGAKRNVGLSMGAGLDRVFVSDRLGFDVYWPNVRLVNLGIAF
jgi:hypothetical protein